MADPYRRLGVAGLMVSLLREDSTANAEIIDDHRAIVDAYERGSLLDAVAVIKRHNENAKEDHPAGDRGSRWRPLTASNDPYIECQESAWQTAPMQSVK